MLYKSMIQKALLNDLIEPASVPLYGSFSFQVENELVQLNGLWLAGTSGITFFSDTEDYYVNKTFPYKDIRSCSKKVSLLAMSPKIELSLLDGTSYTMLVEQEDAKRFVQAISDRLQNV